MDKNNLSVDTVGIHCSVIRHGEIVIGKEVIIEPNCYIGYTYADQRANYYKKIKNDEHLEDLVTCIGDSTYIGPNSIIGKGSTIGKHCIIEPYTFLGEHSQIGDRVFLRYTCRIYRNVVIGDDCIIAGFICNNTKIGRNVRFFGACLHSFIFNDWDAVEKSPEISDNAFIGFDAKIVGGITIGKGAIVKAGALVTRDLKEGEVVGLDGEYLDG